MVIWLIGLSKSGKTTIAKKLIKSLNAKKKTNFFHLDGDVIRKIYNDKLGHSIKDRKINAMRISKICKLLSDQKINVVASVLSNFPYWQKWNKKNIKNYKQVFLKVDLSILLLRDKQKLYQKAINKKIKNVVGIDIKFKKPIKSSIVINNNKNLKNVNPVVEEIIKKLKIK